ncbi:MAG: gluconokinase [Paenibacillaceae bacterium]|nr:gluconokinase [Paenibacillaceae bacterium]
MKLVIGLDIGTTSTKAVVFTAQGAMLSRYESAYPLEQPEPSRAVQDPERIVRGVADSVRGALAEAGASGDDVAAVGISAAMHSLMLLDKRGDPLTPLITWADSRSSEQAARLKLEHGGGNGLYGRTGTPVHPMSPLTKIIWFREREPEVFSEAAMFAGIKEYVLYRLFGQYVVDESVASATGMFNLETADWDEQALALAGIDRSRLPELVPATAVLTGMAPGYAAAMGIGVHTPFAVGASDGALANLGVGAAGPGEAAVTIGTSGAMRVMSPRPLTDPRGRTFCYAVDGSRWIIGGASNNGGMLLSWFINQLASSPGGGELASRSGLSGRSYEAVIRSAGAVAAGAEGLLFLPYMTGERAPHWNPDARGVFFGVALHHRQEHFARAIMEGVVLCIRSISAAVEELTGPVKEVRASGGFARSPVWRQMLSDMLGRELLVPESHEASALGAAIMALCAIGELSSPDEAKGWVRIGCRHEPDQQVHLIYQELFHMFEDIYGRLAPEFPKMTRFQRTGAFAASC